MTDLRIHQQHEDEIGRANCPAAFAWKARIHLRPNWRRDLNYILANAERSFVDSPRKLDHRAALIERAHGAVTLVPATKKPFDVLAEGLVSENSRGDGTPLELFIAGVSNLEVEVRSLVNEQPQRA
jgi:hypothetical protein